MKITKTINLGLFKIEGYKNRNRIILDLSLDLKNENTNNEYYTFSCCGSIGNFIGGQCLDEIAKYCKSDLFMTIYEIWKNYHLNDMQAGTHKQTIAVNNYFKINNLPYNYTTACEYLKSIDLYIDTYTGHSIGGYKDNIQYKYGHGWLVKIIPSDILDTIKIIVGDKA